MRIIIAGSRSFSNYKMLCRIMDKVTFKLREFTILSGHAPGADQLGEKWCLEVAWMPLEIYHPNYELYGRAAPLMRNEMMARAADGLVAFYDGESQGTKHMIERARVHELKVKVVKV